MTSWQISDRVAFETSSPERVVVLHLDRLADKPLAILGGGAAIWSTLAAGEETGPFPVVTESDLLQELANQFELEPEALTADVQSFLGVMSVKKFVIQHTDSD